MPAIFNSSSLLLRSIPTTRSVSLLCFLLSSLHFYICSTVENKDSQCDNTNIWCRDLSRHISVESNLLFPFSLRPLSIDSGCGIPLIDLVLIR